MKKPLIISLTVIIAIIIAVGIYFIIQSQNKPTDFSVDPIIVTPSTNKAIKPLVDGRQCYTYSHEGTPDAPYTTYELIDMTIVGTKVTGTKHGTQSGPDMTNGYTGTITGTLAGDTINVAFAYTVEGSKNTEQEIYQASLTGIDRLQYPLIDKYKDGLFPDTSKPFKRISYARVGCEGASSGRVMGKLPAGSPLPPKTSDIVGQTWVWEKNIIGGDGVVPVTKPGKFSITFGKDGRVSGTTDCNGFGGEYTIGSDGIISFGPFMSTLMYCEGSQETDFTSSLAQATRMTMDADGNLTFILGDTSNVMVLSKK